MVIIRVNLSINNNIITENGTFGIDRDCGNVTTSYNNVWANVSGDYIGSINKIGNISSSAVRRNYYYQGDGRDPVE